MHTGCVVYAHWKGLLITGSVMSEAADRVSVVGFRRLPFVPKRDSCGLLRVRIILANVERSNKTRVDRRSKKLGLALAMLASSDVSPDGIPRWVPGF